ncbi:MAG: hypothetical protein JST00_21375 [Deltaproteobacteria bacterium]|nr:hypothetical protein [Deltaproteobacteria bacterium]
MRREEPLVQALGDRGRAFLKKTRSRRRGETSTRAALTARYRRFGRDFVEAVVRFEERYGGWEIDPKRSEIELGVGGLLARDIVPAIDADARVALVGTGRDEDLHLALDVDPARAGWLLVSRADRVVGELATSVEKWVERIAALAAPPFADRPYAFEAVSVEDPFTSGLSLQIDAEASDATFLLASSADVVLERHVLGTPWLRGRSRVVCRDFAALVRVLEVAHAAGLGGGIAVDAELRDEPLPAPRDEAKLVRTLRPRTRLVLDDGDSRIYLMDDARIECLRRDEEGRVISHTTLRPKRGVRREYIEPW